jgi:hypothetical protein
VGSEGGQGRKATSKATQPSRLRRGEDWGIRLRRGYGGHARIFKGKFKNRVKDKITSKTNQHRMNYPSGIIGGAAWLIVRGTGAKGWATAK